MTMEIEDSITSNAKERVISTLSDIIQVLDSRVTDKIEYLVKYKSNQTKWVEQSLLLANPVTKVAVLKFERTIKLSQKIKLGDFQRMTPQTERKVNELDASAKDSKRKLTTTKSPPSKRSKKSKVVDEIFESEDSSDEIEELPLESDSGDEIKKRKTEDAERITKRRNSLDFEFTNTVEESEYEKKRRQQIEQNLLFVKQLGLIDISQEFKKSDTPVKKSSPRPKKERTSPKEETPTRRSSRLKGEPVSYNVDAAYKELDTSDPVRQRSGNKKNPLIYDSVNGVTCHQCRQKTITPKSVCKNGDHFPVGQHRFCASCLRLRYNENLDEVLKNPDWVCPPCRGTCNCSHCRRRR